MIVSFVRFMIFGKKMPESEKDVDNNGWNTTPSKKPAKTGSPANAGQPQQAR